MFSNKRISLSRNTLFTAQTHIGSFLGFGGVGSSYHVVKFLKEVFEPEN